MNANARTLEAIILSRVAGVKNEVIGAAIGHDHTHISRICSCERGIRLNELEAFLSVIGLSVIETNGAVVSMSQERAEALRLLAVEALSK